MSDWERTGHEEWRGSVYFVEWENPYGDKKILPNMVHPDQEKGKPMEWRPSDRAIPMDRALLWIDDKHYSGAVMGRIVKSHIDGDISFIADGFHGDWNVTHFCAIEPPEPKA